MPNLDAWSVETMMYHASTKLGCRKNPGLFVGSGVSGFELTRTRQFLLAGSPRWHKSASILTWSRSSLYHYRILSTALCRRSTILKGLAKLGRRFGKGCGKCLLRLDAAKIHIFQLRSTYELGAKPRIQSQIDLWRRVSARPKPSL